MENVNSAHATAKEKTLVKRQKLLTDVNYMRYTNNHNLINSISFAFNATPRDGYKDNGT
jgi:hypothetical protein